MGRLDEWELPRVKRLTLFRQRSQHKRRTWQQSRRWWSYHLQGIGTWWYDGAYRTTLPGRPKPRSARDYGRG